MPNSKILKNNLDPNQIVGGENMRSLDNSTVAWKIKREIMYLKYD